ncbi:MAG: regulatory protein RecX [Firmicutes bacterium]|nr:regulatory protein RecX [Bacillota bacterium]
MRIDGKTDIRDVAAKFLAYRSHTTWEMRKHLLEKEYDEDQVSQVLADFMEYGYLDDERYAKEYMEYAFGKNKGKNRVFQELKEKGIDRDVIQFAYEDLEDQFDEKQLAREEAFRVLRTADIYAEDGQICEEDRQKIDEKLVAKVARRLQSKGYGSDTIYGVIGELRR